MTKDEGMSIADLKRYMDAQENNSGIDAEYRDPVSGTMITLNRSLIRQQGLEQDAVDTLKETHIEKSEIFKAMANAKGGKELRTLAARVQAIEFEQQAIWGFDLNPAYHYWFIVPRCDCPKKDNKERYGTVSVILNSDCPVHGGQPFLNTSYDELTGWKFDVEK